MSIAVRNREVRPGERDIVCLGGRYGSSWGKILVIAARKLGLVVKMDKLLLRKSSKKAER